MCQVDNYWGLKLFLLSAIDDETGTPFVASEFVKFLIMHTSV